jgi:glycosyltransferase involved in cell wall biosynthesis
MGIPRHLMFSLASTIICYGYSEQSLLKKSYPRKQLLVAGNSSVLRRDCAPLTGVPSERNNVLFMGRLSAAKKPLLLLQALELLQKQGLSIGAVLIGDGPESQSCREFAQKSCLADVHFAGACFDRSKIRALAGSTFCLASPGYVGLSVLDGQSIGLPVVYCHDEPNAPEVEVLRDGENALSFRKDSANSLAAALRQLHGEREEWLGRSERSALNVAKRYSIENMAQQFVSFFRASV